MSLREPLYIAEVLTMGQVLILWEHAIANLETACIVHTMSGGEGISVTFAALQREWIDFIDMILSILIRDERHKLEADGIVQACLIDDDFEVVLRAGVNVAVVDVVAPVDAYHVDGILALCDDFLPKGNLLGKTVVVGLKLL